MTLHDRYQSDLPSRYQFRRILARGASGDVIEALDLESGPIAVAIKLLRAEGTQADIAKAMFRREIEALEGLRHDGIVRILDKFYDDGLLGIVLELVPGGHTLSTLFEDVRIGRVSPMAPAWRVSRALRILEALAAAHRRNVIHRDIKPGNVLWNRHEDELKLADFGIAAVLTLTARDPSGPTLRSFYSRPYASPEQLLQRAPSFASDVYGFSLLTAALLGMCEPGEEFEPSALSELLTPFLTEVEAFVSAADRQALSEALARGLSDDPNERPSLSELCDVLGRVRAALVEPPVAAIVLTKSAREKLAAIGFTSNVLIEKDLNTDLRVVLDRKDGSERIKLYGQTLFMVLSHGGACEVARALELPIIDAGQNPGPAHEKCRVHASPCPVRLRLGSGSSAALLAYVAETERRRTERFTHELIERAELIIRVERERLPVFLIDGVIEGERVKGREERVGRASGYEGSATEKVPVQGAFVIEVRSVTHTLWPMLKNLVKMKLDEQCEQSTGFADRAHEFADDSGEGFGGDEESADNVGGWQTLFDELGDIEVLDERQQLIGKVTGFDDKQHRLHVKTEKRRTLHRSGYYVVRNYQKERQLKKQETALLTLSRGEATRPDLQVLLSDAAAHEMGEKPFVDLMQSGLKPEARVRDLVDRILASRSIFCLQGPPGTGKTTVIAEVVAQVLACDPSSRILVCSQANDAVANAIERIRGVREKLGLDWLVVRDVRPDRAKEEGGWAGYDAAYAEFRDRLTAASGAERSEAISTIVDEWLHALKHRSRHVERDHRGLVQVWGTTTSRAEGPLNDLDGDHYDLVIVDEAAKATVGEVLVPLVHARRILLVGDQKQLPPFLEDTTKEAMQELGHTEEELKYSLFEHLFELVPRDHRDMLDTQFRMHPTIGDVVSRLFYDGKIKNGPGTENRPLPAGGFDRPHRVMWVDVVGRDVLVDKTSRANEEEAETIVRLLDKLEDDTRKANATLSVAVIAPYRAQVRLLKDMLHKHERRWKALSVTAATVDAFQGREADVVFYSMVRVGSTERRFIADGRRFNVALSRSKRLLVMVGDRSGARGTPTLETLLGMVPADNQVDAEAFAPRAEWLCKLDAARAATPPRPRSSQLSRPTGRGVR